jgi:hypothetical protein
MRAESTVMARFRGRMLYAGLLCLAVAMLLNSPIHTPQLLDNETGVSVLLLTAHPDDECMFFSPTLLAFVSLGVQVFALSLSTGMKIK